MAEPVAVEGAPGREPDVPAAPSQSVVASAVPAAAATTANAANMGTGGGSVGGMKPEEPNVSWQDIKSVQNLIERCLQKFMTQTEIIAALQVEANVDPSFTCLVWQKLEQQNPEFFFSYHARLKMRDQIVAFNYLVDQQVYLIRVASAGMMPHPPPPGMHPGMPQGLQPGMVPHHPLSQHHPQQFAPPGMPVMVPPPLGVVGGRQSPRQQTPPPPMSLPPPPTLSTSSLLPPPTAGVPPTVAYPSVPPSVSTPSPAASLPLSTASVAAAPVASPPPPAPPASAPTVAAAPVTDANVEDGGQAARTALCFGGQRREVSSTTEGVAVGGDGATVGVGAAAVAGGAGEVKSATVAATPVVASVREAMDVDVGGGEPEPDEVGVIDVV